MKISRISYIEENGIEYKYRVYKDDFNTRDGVYIYGEFETKTDAINFINNNQSLL